VLTRLYLCHTNRSIDELPQERASKRTKRMLSGAINAATNIGLAAGDGAEVDDVPGLARLEACGSSFFLSQGVVEARECDHIRGTKS
jgi:hypothetical protein